MPRAAFTEGVSDTDPHASLEKVLDEDNLKWVEQQNKVTVDRLGEIRGTKTYERILEALDSLLRCCLLRLFFVASLCPCNAP